MITYQTSDLLSNPVEFLTLSTFTNCHATYGMFHQLIVGMRTTATFTEVRRHSGNYTAINFSYVYVVVDVFFYHVSKYVTRFRCNNDIFIIN